MTAVHRNRDREARLGKSRWSDGSRDRWDASRQTRVSSVVDFFFLFFFLCFFLSSYFFSISGSRTVVAAAFLHLPFIEENKTFGHRKQTKGGRDVTFKNNRTSRCL